MLLLFILTSGTAIAFDRWFCRTSGDRNVPSDEVVLQLRNLLLSLGNVSANNLAELRKLQHAMRTNIPLAEQTLRTRLSVCSKTLDSLERSAEKFVHDLDSFRGPNRDFHNPAERKQALEVTHVSPLPPPSDTTPGAQPSLSGRIEHHEPQSDRFEELISAVNENVLRGAPTNDVLTYIYTTLRPIIPYERMGFALVNEEENTVTSTWARSEIPTSLLNGFSASLTGSSLALVLQRKCPRILNDLPTYLRHRPDSASTRLIVEDGFRSSLTCPVTLVGGEPGFLFFTSTTCKSYTDEHGHLARRLCLALSGEGGSLQEFHVSPAETREPCEVSACYDTFNTFGEPNYSSAPTDPRRR